MSKRFVGRGEYDINLGGMNYHSLLAFGMKMAANKACICAISDVIIYYSPLYNVWEGYAKLSLFTFCYTIGGGLMKRVGKRENKGHTVGVCI